MSKGCDLSSPVLEKMVDFLEQIKLILTIFREVIVTDALLKVFVIVDLNSVSMQSDFTFC